VLGSKERTNVYLDFKQRGEILEWLEDFQILSSLIKVERSPTQSIVSFNDGRNGK
jgi:hypothetical protein